MKIAAAIATALFALVAILLVSQGWYIVAPAGDTTAIWRIHKVTGTAEWCRPTTTGVLCEAQERWWAP